MAFFRIRLGSPDDHPFLREMLFEAAYGRLDQERPSLETGRCPQIWCICWQIGDGR